MDATQTREQQDLEVKDRLRAVWSLGDYPRVAAEIIPALGRVLVEACGVRSGQRVLDVAAGAGNAAFPAAEAGAHVVASDLTAVLLDHGRLEAARRGLEGIEWRVADAEALPFEDGEFDVVMSCVGAMFAPRHQAVADEVVRVCRPGGTIGFVSWTPDGFIGRMFAAMKPYAAPPPAGAQPPPLWGEEGHVKALLGDRVSDLSLVRRELPVTAFRTGEEFRDYFKAHYGPTIATYRSLADDLDRTATLDTALAALGDTHLRDGTMSWGYLLATAVRA